MMAGEWEDVPTVKSSDGWEDVTPQRRASDKVQVDKTGDALKSAAPYFMGPAGGLRAIHEGSKALDKYAYDTGGQLTDFYSKFLPAEVAAGLGTVGNVAIQAVPAMLSGSGAARVAAPALESGAQALMQSALKPSIKDLKSGRAATAIQTMLDEGINATAGGVAQLKGKINELNSEIAKRIGGSTEVIDKQSVYGPLKETLDKFSKQVNPTADLAKIRGAWDDFVNHPLITGSLPVQLAQELKQGTYKVLSKKYGEVGSAETEAQKAIARGLKEKIAEAVPEIASLNAHESKLITAMNVAERRALMEANKNPMGLSLLAGHPAAWAAFMADRSGAFKSIIARMLHSGSERIPQAAVATGVAGAEAYNNRPPQPRQSGGPVSAGRPYLVGEAGPEVIVPSGSGTVIPNKATYYNPRGAPQMMSQEAVNYLKQLELEAAAQTQLRPNTLQQILASATRGRI